MQVLTLHPGVNMEQVTQATSFPLEVADRVGQTSEPTPGELEILRTEVDPHRYILGRAL
jgi:glutaconate CoA-transferase subunit B